MSNSTMRDELDKGLHGDKENIAEDLSHLWKTNVNLKQGDLTKPISTQKLHFAGIDPDPWEVDRKN